MKLRLQSLRARLSSAFGRDARRLRRVARHPELATHADIELLLRAHGVVETKVWAAIDQLEQLGVSAQLAWAFVMEYDGVELADTLASGAWDATGSRAGLAEA
ncbi:MAG: hypothetical protein CMJ44_13980 [Pimelobacter sp.]|nr:hypothetical protein [Pimelobacter sp.]